jgi:predicted Zn-dependent protease with MMP-like domain
MTIPYLFIDPATAEEKQLLKQVETLVGFHFHDLCRHTSKPMREILKKLVVRTMWESSSRDKYGEYYGVPAPRQPPYDSGVLPPEIVVFAYPLLRDYPDQEALNKKVRIVIIHEIGHHLGLPEAELRRRHIY